MPIHICKVSLMQIILIEVTYFLRKVVHYTVSLCDKQIASATFRVRKYNFPISADCADFSYHLLS